MPRIASYAPIHYGCEYLEHSIRGVEDFVDKHLLLYCPHPSYGHGTDLVCPDTKEELKEIALSFSHVEWIEGDWHNESAHRNAVLPYVEGYDLLLPVDADEVWDPKMLDVVINQVYQSNSARSWRVYGFVHMWRSFYWSCSDGMAPVRVIDLRHEGGEAAVHGTVYHFGYAQSVAIMKYKWSCHGHQAELKPGWLENTFINWVPGMKDVHPTCNDIWNPELFDPRDLPRIMRDHPYYGGGLIE